jgi:hypothetical protein
MAQQKVNYWWKELKEELGWKRDVSPQKQKEELRWRKKVSPQKWEYWWKGQKEWFG